MAAARTGRARNRRKAGLNVTFGSIFASTHLAVGQNQWYHFGAGAPPSLVYFSVDWDVQRALAQSESTSLTNMVFLCWAMFSRGPKRLTFYVQVIWASEKKSKRKKR